MPLARPGLIDALLGSFTLNTFDDMLAAYLNHDREWIIAGTGTVSFPDIVTAVVTHADRYRWAGELIRGALKANPGSPKLKAFVAKYPDWDPAAIPAPPPGSYYHSVFMRGRRVFLKRNDFRQLLQEIGTPGKSRVLAIDGDRWTGKTYSREFLNFIRENEPTWAGREQRIIYVCLDECVFEPEELAAVIGKRLGLAENTMPPDRGEQAPRRIPALIDWLSGVIEENKSPVEVWWLVLDGFRVQVHPRATHDLIRALIDVTDREWDRARLLLLNYTKNMDLDTPAFILCETIQPIERKDLENFFKHVYALSGKAWDQANITQTVDDVLVQVEAAVKNRGVEVRLKVLSTALTRAANNLLA